MARKQCDTVYGRIKFNGRITAIQSLRKGRIQQEDNSNTAYVRTEFNGRITARDSLCKDKFQ